MLRMLLDVWIIDEFYEFSKQKGSIAYQRDSLLCDHHIYITINIAIFFDITKNNEQPFKKKNKTSLNRF